MITYLDLQCYFYTLSDYKLGFAVWSHANGRTEKLTFPREWTIYYRIYDYFFLSNNTHIFNNLRETTISVIPFPYILSNKSTYLPNISFS